MGSAGSVDRQGILEAALAEVIARGIDAFTVDGVAARAGVDVSVITGIWGDGRVLLLEAQLASSSQRVPLPDTGSLRGDLQALSASQAELAETATGRRWVQRFLSADGDADLSEIRADFWRARHQEMVRILQRAEERGELRDDVELDDAMRMFLGASLVDIVVGDSAPRPGYFTQLLDIFIRGISKDAPSQPVSRRRSTRP